MGGDYHELLTVFEEHCAELVAHLPAQDLQSPS